VSSRACLTNRLQIRGKRFFIGGTHPRMFTELDVLRFVSYSHLPKEFNSHLFAPGQFCPQSNIRRWWQIRKRVDRGSRISVAKTESLRKFLLVFIKVDQVSVILGILGMSPEHREMRRADDYNHAHRMPHTGL
jgi:hypothetical protein